MSNRKCHPQFFKVKASLLTGSNYYYIHKQALLFFKQIKQKTKRKPYIRSKHFKKQKVFFDYFWLHLSQKRLSDRKRRLKLFACAIELIRKSKYQPHVIKGKHFREYYYRFYGQTKNNIFFAVQIKKKLNSNYQLLSIFPINKKPSARWRL